MPFFSWSMVEVLGLRVLRVKSTAFREEVSWKKFLHIILIRLLWLLPLVLLLLVILLSLLLLWSASRALPKKNITATRS